MNVNEHERLSNVTQRHKLKKTKETVLLLLFYIIFLPLILYITGDKPAMIDYDLWPWYERIGAIKSLGIDLLPKEKFPNLCRWVERMRNLPAVKETLFDDETHVAFYKTYTTGKPNYDIGL